MAYKMTVVNPAPKGKKMAKRKKKSSTKKKTSKRKPAKKKVAKKKATKRKPAKKKAKKKVAKRKPAKKKAAKRKPAKKKAAKRKPAKKKAAKRKPAKKKAAKKKAAKRKPAKKKKVAKKTPARRKKASKKAPVRAVRKAKRWPKKVTSTTTAGKKKSTRVPKIRYTVPQAETRISDAAAYVGTSKFTGKRRRAKLPGLAGAAQRLQLKSQGYIQLNPEGNPIQPVPGFPRMFVRTPAKGAKSRKVAVAVKVGKRDSTRAGRGSTKTRAPSSAKQAEIERIRKKYGIKKKR